MYKSSAAALFAISLASGCATKMYEGHERPAAQVATVAGSFFYFIVGSSHTCILTINGERTIASEVSRYRVLPGDVVLHVAALTDVGGLSSGCNSNLRRQGVVRFEAVAGRSYTIRNRRISKDGEDRTQYWVEDDETGAMVAEGTGSL